MQYEQELNKLTKLFDAGVFSAPFYQKRGIQRKVFSSYEEFKKLPFMTKRDIRSSSAFERSSTSLENVYGLFSSSGTTGAKTFYVYSDEDRAVQESCARRFYSSLGVTSKDLGGVLAPVDTGVMAHTMMWQYSAMGAGYVNCPVPSPDAVLDLVSSLPVSILSSRPEVLTMVGLSASDASVLKNNHVRMLLPGGSFLSEARRALLENLWGANCYNMYGMSEVFGPLAGECRLQNGQHYPNDLLFIELVDPETQEPVAEGEMGVAVYTTLWAKGMPLIRYWTDDYMRVDSTPCACGSSMPRLFYCGRQADCIHLENGTILFPKDLEELIVPHGYVGGYRVFYERGGVTRLELETARLQEVPDGSLIESVERFFRGPCQIKHVGFGAIGMSKVHFFTTEAR